MYLTNKTHALAFVDSGYDVIHINLLRQQNSSQFHAKSVESKHLAEKLSIIKLKIMKRRRKKL